MIRLRLWPGQTRLSSEFYCWWVILQYSPAGRAGVGWTGQPNAGQSEVGRRRGATTRKIHPIVAKNGKNFLSHSLLWPLYAPFFILTSLSPSLLPLSLVLSHTHMNIQQSTHTHTHTHSQVHTCAHGSGK